MERFRDGWILSKRSLSILADNPRLGMLPAIGSAVATVATIAVIAPGLYLLARGPALVGIGLVFVGYYLASLAATFFGVGLAAMADAAFRGEEMPLGSALATARSRFPSVAGWALISAGVGTLIAVLKSERVGAALLGRLGDIAWGVLSCVAVPLIALEGTGPLETFRRTASLFGKSTPSQRPGNLLVTTILGVVVHVPAYLLVFLGTGVALQDDDLSSSDGIAGLLVGLPFAVAGVGLFCASIVLMQTLRQLFGVALYHYLADQGLIAGDQKGSAGFTRAELALATKPL